MDTVQELKDRLHLNLLLHRWSIFLFWSLIVSVRSAWLRVAESVTT